MTVTHSHPARSAAALVALATQAPEAPPRALPARIELRWTCTASRCGFASSGGGQPGVHDRADFIITLERAGSSTASIQAVLVPAPGGRPGRTIAPRSRVRCDVQHEGRWLHVDIFDLGAANGAEAMLKLSLAADGALGYVHTPLLASAGLPGGSFDRPAATVH